MRSHLNSYKLECNISSQYILILYLTWWWPISAQTSCKQFSHVHNKTVLIVTGDFFLQ